MQYNVVLKKDITVSLTVEVEADSEEEAMETAQEEHGYRLDFSSGLTGECGDELEIVDGCAPYVDGIEEDEHGV